VLSTPLRGDRLLGEVLGSVGPVAFDVAVQRTKVGPEVREYFTQTGFGQFGGGCRRSGG
jgi:hypothetical protein